MSSRHLSRSIVMQSLYEWDFSERKKDLLKIVEKNIKEFGPGLEDVSFIWQLTTGIVQKLTKINKIIEKAAPEWPLNQINIIDRNVLRIGLFELLYGNKEEVPPKVAISRGASRRTRSALSRSVRRTTKARQARADCQEGDAMAHPLRDSTRASTSANSSRWVSSVADIR